jgi:hypothetical protein
MASGLCARKKWGIMKNCLHIQIQLDRLVDFDEECVFAFLKRTNADVKVQKGRPKEAYINFSCWTEGPVLSIWRQVQRLLAEHPVIQNAAIVCCTAEHGWDDYLLLHHYLAEEPLDVLER